MPWLHRCVSFQLKQFIDITTGHRAETHRCVVWSEHRRACFGDRATCRASGDGDTVDVADLALVCAETECGVSLYVFDTLKAFPCGEFDCRRGNVELVVDKLRR